MLLAAPPCANHEWKYCILQLRNMGRMVMFPTLFLDDFSSSLSRHVPPLLSWRTFPLFALHPAYSSSFPTPRPCCNPFSWQKRFLLYTSSKSKGILGLFTWLVSHVFKACQKVSFKPHPSKAFELLFCAISLHHMLPNIKRYLTVLAHFSFLL